ncbi:MAG TPA: hypothetical protein LFW10_04670 [Rickettsia endosymbiont of Diachasma alloeum]|nr:hypothetical protein [Rickettsia endosymbiont of Diachasma alloeum]
MVEFTKCKINSQLLQIIADSETNPFTSDSGPLAPSWNFIAFWRYLDANPTRAIETFHKKFPSCTEIKVEPFILLTSLHEYDPINDFAKLGIKLLGVLNEPISSEAYLEV